MSIKKFASARGIDFKYAKGKNDIYGNSFHNRFELYLLLGGNVSLIIDRARISLRPYQLAIIPPGQFHQFTVEGNVDDYERCVLNLDIDFIDPAALKDALSGKELLTLSSDGRIVNNMLYLKEHLDRGKDSDLLYILPAVATDIIFCVKNTESSLRSSSSGICILSQDIINYLNSHYTDKIDLSMLSKRFHVSVSTLCHIFKKDFGITVKQYLMQKRLNAANLFLGQGERAEEVCEKVGFTNYSAFFRAYKKQFSTSPSRSANGR